MHPLAIQSGFVGERAGISFPRRTDAALRGISYLVEWSDSLAPGSWTTIAPPGTTGSVAAWNPAVAGFEQAVLSWPDAATPRFCRVRVELDEDG